MRLGLTLRPSLLGLTQSLFHGGAHMCSLRPHGQHFQKKSHVVGEKVQQKEEKTNIQ